MNYALSIVDGYIIGVCESEDHFSEEITKAERDTIFNKLLNRPSSAEGYEYKLRADNLEWELIELPTVEDNPTAEELMEIIMGGAE